MEDEENHSHPKPEELTTKASTIHRLQQFSYYLSDSIEKNLNFCLTLLENHPTSKKPNSNPVTVISTLATPLPYIGRGLSTALKQGEIYIQDKIDNNNSRSVADLVYHFNDNKEKMRKLLLESSIEIFYCFEQQFMKITCEGGPPRAMQKLAKDAANRMFSSFLKNKQGGDVSKNDITKAVIFGDSMKNKFGVKSGKTVTKEEEEWKTASIYKKVGLFLEESGEFFGNEDTKTKKYGYRRTFPWEEIDEIRAKWSPETSDTPVYNLSKEELPGLLLTVREYAMTKNVNEEATLDREKKHEEVMDDQEKKHQEVMAAFLDRFGRVFEDLRKNYEEIKASRHENAVIVTTMEEDRTLQEERHREISSKLSEVHGVVVETKEQQLTLVRTAESIQNEVCEIKTKQEELSSGAVEVMEAIRGVSERETPSLGDLVKDNYEVKKVTRVVNEVKESVRGVEPKVRKEIKRGLKKMTKFR